MEQEKIKEIVNNLKREDGLLEIGKYDDEIIEQALQEYGQWVRQQTLEEAEKCVPKEVFCQTQPMATDYGNIQSALLVEGVNKWNNCRQQTLSNLQALKDKNK